MHILWLDPFHGGSHAAVAAGYAARSRHQVSLLALSQAGGWRWRMRGGAVTLARLAAEAGHSSATIDLIVATDMLDLAVFRALSPGLAGAPAALYFHENQLTYPLPPGRQRDLSLGWVNYTAAMAADAVIFNSDFHRRDFLGALPGLLGRHHDHHELETIGQLAARSHVLPPGIDLAELGRGPGSAGQGPPVILWNSRWEYDKQPAAFFAALEDLAARGAAFRLIVAGEHIDPRAPEFVAARERWSHLVEHWGYAPGRAAYVGLLRRADLVVSTAIQEFFGIGVVEAMACGCAPVLPRRLNYPDLIPPELQAQALYDEGGLAGALAAALARPPARERWGALAAPFGWDSLAPRYDALLEQIAQGCGRQ